MKRSHLDPVTELGQRRRSGWPTLVAAARANVILMIVWLVSAPVSVRAQQTLPELMTEVQQIAGRWPANKPPPCADVQKIREIWDRAVRLQESLRSVGETMVNGLTASCQAGTSTNSNKPPQVAAKTAAEVSAEARASDCLKMHGYSNGDDQTDHGIPLPQGGPAYEASCRNERIRMQYEWAKACSNGNLIDSVQGAIAKSDTAAVQEHLDQIQRDRASQAPFRNTPDYKAVLNWEECVLTVRLHQGQAR